MEVASVNCAVKRFLACLLVASASAQAQPNDPELQAFLDQVNRPIILQTPGVERIRPVEGLEYRPGGQSWQRADLYLPENEKRPFPVVILVHGGVGDLPLRPKDWGLYRSWGRLLAAHGFAAITFNHGLGFPEPRIDEGAEDLRALLTWAKAQAASRGLDMGRVALAFFSAGGVLLTPYLSEPPAGLLALVAIYPIVDVEGSNHIRSYYSAEKRRALSPLAQLERSGPTAPPTLVVRAGRDAIPDLLPGLDRFLARAVERNLPIRLINLPKAAHGFDNDAGTAGGPEAIRAVLQFLAANLQRTP